MSELAKTTADLLVKSGAYVSVWEKDDWVKVPGSVDVPAYLSCRRMLSNPTAKKALKSLLVEAATTNFNQATSVIGLATAGIVWGDAVSDGLNLPFGYVRTEKKAYGIGSFVEGAPPESSSAIVVDDTLFTGDSIISASETLMTEKSINTFGVLAIASLHQGGVESLESMLGCKVVALTNYENLSNAAVNNGLLSPEQGEQMINYYESPSDYLFRK